jgi:hypothetical protein
MNCADCGVDLRGDERLDFTNATVVCRADFEKRVVRRRGMQVCAATTFTRLPDDLLNLDDGTRLMWAS